MRAVGGGASGLGNGGHRGGSSPLGVTRYCMATPMTFETIQYMDSPMGNCTEKKAIIIGIIQSIIV